MSNELLKWNNYQLCFFTWSTKEISYSLIQQEVSVLIREVIYGTEA